MAAAAVVALAAGSQGHVLLLGVLLALVVGSRLGGVACLVAAAVPLVRWGDGSLSALGGNQAVLGPALLVGDLRTAASAALAALAIALAAPRHPLLAVAAGVAAGAVVAGPTVPHDLGWRIAGAVACAALALAARWVPFRGPAALGAALVALGCAA